MSFWNKLFKKRSEDWFYYHLPAAQTPQDVELKTLEREKDYVNIFLKSMRIVNVRKGLSKFYGTTHSFCKLKHPGGTDAEFNIVTTPGQLEQMDAKNIDRVVNINKRLVGPTAYKGGDMEMEVGLFSIKSADLAAPFISLLEDMSGLAGVSFLSAAIPYAEPIKKGINLLTGGESDTVLEIGLSQSFSKIKTGYYVVMRVPKNEIDKNDIKVSSDYRLTDLNDNPIQDYPYLVIQIAGTSKKEDWFNIPELQAAYHKLMEDVRKGDFNNAKDSLLFFKRTVLTSYDLLFQDAQKIVKEVEDTVGAIMDTTRTSGTEKRELPLLDSFQIY